MSYYYKGVSFNIQYSHEDGCWTAVAKSDKYLLLVDGQTPQGMLPCIKEMVDDYILNHINKR